MRDTRNLILIVMLFEVCLKINLANLRKQKGVYFTCVTSIVKKTVTERSLIWVKLSELNGNVGITRKLMKFRCVPRKASLGRVVYSCSTMSALACR